jgi:hypothetical protein
MNAHYERFWLSLNRQLNFGPSSPRVKEALWKYLIMSGYWSHIILLVPNESKFEEFWCYITKKVNFAHETLEVKTQVHELLKSTQSQEKIVISDDVINDEKIFILLTTSEVSITSTCQQNFTTLKNLKPLLENVFKKIHGVQQFFLSVMIPDVPLVDGGDIVLCCELIDNHKFIHVDGVIDIDLCESHEYNKFVHMIKQLYKMKCFT